MHLHILRKRVEKLPSVAHFLGYAIILMRKMLTNHIYFHCFEERCAENTYDFMTLDLSQFSSTVGNMQILKNSLFWCIFGS